MATIAWLSRIHHEDDCVIVTHACQHTVRATGRRCGQPYALVVTRDAARYVFAGSFAELEQLLGREVPGQ